MNPQALEKLLATLRFGQALPADVLQRVATLASLRSFAADSVLFREGGQNDQLMIVSAGRVALDMQVPSRGEVRILSLGPGDIVAWSAILGGGRMTTSAVALVETEVVAIRGSDLLALCDVDAALGYHLMRHVARALADRLVATRLQLLDLFADTEPVIPPGPD